MPDPDHAAADPNATTGIASASAQSAAPLTATQRYVLGEEIARGGMGVVYRATDVTLGREVALKVLHELYGPDSGVARRFADEARIAGQLQHPAIPPVHDLGALPDGRPFLAMKLIKGATLDRLLQARPDASAERGRFVAAFEQVCQALAYAHSHDVIHRDLKPSNVMVGSFGEVQVMDWGLAKVLGARPSGPSDPEQTAGATQVGSLRDSDGALTQAGSVLGTPAFMPPEQAAGALGKVDARSDVFGLGAILAVILTGQPPFAARSAETTRVMAAQGDVAECFARLDACGAESDLVALCKRCLSPRPADRPADAGAVAQAVADLRAAADERARRAELERVRVEGEKAAAQAQAREVRKRQRLTKALAGALLVAALALLAGAGAAAWFAIRADENARRADEKAQEAKASARQVTEGAYLSHVRSVQRFWDDNLLGSLTEILQKQRPEHTGGLDLRGFEWFYWDRLTRSAATLKGHAASVHGVAISADGKRIVSSSADTTVKVWDADSGQLLRTLKGHADRVNDVAISADGKRIVSGSWDRTVKVWDADSGQAIRTLEGHVNYVIGVAISPDGKRIVSGSADRTVMVWDADSGRDERSLKGHTDTVHSVAISADGKRITSGSSDTTVKVWDAASGKNLRTLKGHAGPVYRVAFSADGKRIVSGGDDRTVMVWDAGTGEQVVSLKGHSQPVFGVAFGPDGKRVVSGSSDRLLKVWDADSGQEKLSLKGHAEGLASVAFSADGKRLVSSSSDATVKVWSAERDPSALLLAGHLSQVAGVAISPDGTSIASAGGVWDGKLSRYAAGELKLWDASGQARDLLKQEAGVTCVAFSPDGSLLACGSGTWDARANRYASGEVRLWSADGRAVATLTGHSSSVLSLAFSPDGTQLASAALDGSIRVWDVATRQKSFDLPAQKKAVTAVAFSPDGALLAAAGFDMVVTLHDLRGHKVARTLAANFTVSGLAFSPAGSRLVVAGYTIGEIPVYEVATGKRLLALTGHTGYSTGAAYSPDGRRIATCGEDGTVRLWDAASGQEVLTLRGHTDVLRGVAFSKDGHRLVSGGWDRTVRVWDATPRGD